MPADSARKKREQCALADRIDRVGIEMLQCSFCEKNGKTCIVSSANSRRCSECIRVGKKCDVDGPSVGDWKSLEDAETRLDAETEKAEAAMTEVMARLTRLRKQRKFLKRRGAEMLRRGLKSMDELEEVEEKERKEKGGQNRLPTPLERSPLSADFSESALDFQLLEAPLPDFSDSSFWAAGFAGGTYQAAQGS
jgi:hypothetical protein